MGKPIPVYVLTALSIDSSGDVKQKIAGVTFSLHAAEAHKSKGVEHEFETFEVGADWQEDALETDIVLAMRTFREIVADMQAKALR